MFEGKDRGRHIFIVFYSIIYLVSPHHIIIQMNLREMYFFLYVFKLDWQLSLKYTSYWKTLHFLFQKTISH